MKLNLGKAAGIDGIIPEVIKYLNGTKKESFKSLLKKIIKIMVIIKEWNYITGDPRDYIIY